MPGKKVYPKRSGKVAPSIKSYVKKQMRTNTELKRQELVDQEKLEGILATGTPMFVHNLFYAALGTGVNERIGNEVRLQGVQVKGMWNNNTTLTTYCRVMIGYYIGDNVSIGGLNENTPIFKDSLGNSVGAVIVTAGATKNYAIITTPTHPQMWAPLYDKTFKIGPSTSTDGAQTRLFNKFIKLHNKKVCWDNSASQLTQPRLQLLRFYSDAPQDAATAQVIEYNGLTQVWYRDA